jgi:hypothetical protein
MKFQTTKHQVTSSEYLLVSLQKIVGNAGMYSQVFV